MSTSNMTPVMSLRMPLDLRAELEQLAAADSRTLSAYIVLALREHLERTKKRKVRRS